MVTPPWAACSVTKYSSWVNWPKRIIVGVSTSGGYGYAVAKTLAFAYVEPALAAPGSRVEIEILGQRRTAEVLAAPVYDPANERLKA